MKKKWWVCKVEIGKLEVEGTLCVLQLIKSQNENVKTKSLKQREKTQMMYILTSVWRVQHPNAG